jgi:hypothetical protein
MLSNSLQAQAVAARRGTRCLLAILAAGTKLKQLQLALHLCKHMATVDASRHGSWDHLSTATNHGLISGS